MKLYTRKTVANLLGIEDRQVAQLAEEAGTEVLRAEAGLKPRMYSIHNVFDMAAHLRKKRLPENLDLKVITLNIPRGGTGKTLLATNMAVAFALQGIRTALIDIDYQASATLLMGYDPDINSDIATERGMPLDRAIDYHLGHLIGLSGSSVPFDKVAKHPFGVNGPTLIPADVSITSLDNQLLVDRMSNPKSDLRIANWLVNSPDMQKMEVVIFDSGPGYNKVISAALTASSMVIAPVGLERVSDKGLNILSDQLESIRDNLGVKTELRIVANSMVNTQRVLNEVKHISSKFPGMLLPYSIRRSEDVPKSYAGANSDAELLPFMLEYPSSDVSTSLKQISSAVFQELWTQGVANG